MKNTFSALIVAGLLLIPSFVSAAPVPATYDNNAWSDYLEKGKTNKIPDGIPFGPGAVTGYHGSGFWPEGYIQIIDPFDMSKDPNIELAESAKNNERYFASETEKNFLEAVVKGMRKLSKDDNIKVPVQELFFAPGAVPMRMLSDSTSSIGFGVYIVNGAMTEPATDVRIHGEIASRGAAYVMGASTRIARRYQRYVKRAAPFKARFASMSYTEFYSTTQELLKLASEEAVSDDITLSKEKRQELVDQEKAGTEKINQQKEQTREEISAKYEKELDKLRDKLIQDLSKKERDEVVDKIRAVEKQKQEEIASLDSNNRKGEEGISVIERVDELRMNKRLTPAQRRIRSSSASVRHDGDLVLDEAAMWNLVEAILTQNAANVAEIRMPTMMKNRLVNYAKKAKKNKNVITSLETLFVHAQNVIEVSLSCSTRDRFLGCTLGGSKDIENRIVKASTAMLKEAVKLEPKRQIEIIQLVVNANPVELEYLFDTSKLRLHYDEHFDYVERTRIFRALTALENIPVKGENGMARKRRLNNIRGTDGEFNLENYINDYFNEMMIP